MHELVGPRLDRVGDAEQGEAALGRRGVAPGVERRDAASASRRRHRPARQRLAEAYTSPVVGFHLLAPAVEVRTVVRRVGARACAYVPPRPHDEWSTRMQLSQLQYLDGSGWDAPLPRELDGAATLVIAFGQRHAMDDGMLDELRAAFPVSVIVGCSSAGEVARGQIVDVPLSVVVAAFDQASLHCTSTLIDGVDDSFDAGARLASSLPTAGLRAVLVYATGIGVNGAALVNGLVDHLPRGTPVSGGLAGDGDRFERTWVLADGLTMEHGATAIGLYGDALEIGHGCDGGWQDFGPERTVTRSDGNVLHELDGKPALALYKDYLGDLADQLPGSALLFPLSIRTAPEGRAVVRTILGIDESEQSMTFAGEIPEGSTARLMRTNIDRLAMSAEAAANQALVSVGDRARSDARPVLAISVSCVGRRLVMGERTDEEVEAVTQGLPPGSVLAGFYSYGEISPLVGCADGVLHNQTMTVTVISET
jgi:hypothetical protein